MEKYGGIVKLDCGHELYWERKHTRRYGPPMVNTFVKCEICGEPALVIEVDPNAFPVRPGVMVTEEETDRVVWHVNTIFEDPLELLRALEIVDPNGRGKRWMNYGFTIFATPKAMEMAERWLEREIEEDDKLQRSL